MEELFKKMQQTMQKKGYPISVQETAIGTIEYAKDKALTAEKVNALLEQNLTAREMVKALQPIIKEA